MSLSAGSTVKWIKPDPARQYYELAEGDQRLATLEWIKPERPEATGVIGDRRLAFRHKGFFFHRTSIVDEATGSEIASFEFRLDKGELAFRDGGKFLWKFEGLQGSRWFFTTNRDSELLCFTVPPGRKSAVTREAANVEVLRTIDENILIFLAVVGWYNVHNILATGL